MTTDKPRPTQEQVEAALTSLVRDARLLVSEVSLDEPHELDNINAQAATIRAALAERDAEIARLRAALAAPAAGEE
jgi:hypothetical protein